MLHVPQEATWPFTVLKRTPGVFWKQPGTVKGAQEGRGPARGPQVLSVDDAPGRCVFTRSCSRGPGTPGETASPLYREIT